jgi:tetratricopeptide (TPR) repeat protein
MRRTVLQTIGCLLAVGCACPPVAAQVAEERPVVLQPPPPTPARAERQKAEELVREAQALFGLGVMRQRGDRWLEAVKLLEEAARLDPETPSAWRALVPLYLSLAREEDALEACRKVMRLDPDDADTAYRLAKLLRADNKTREAIAALAQGAASKRAGDRPDLLYFTLDELTDLREKAGDFPAAAADFERLARHLADQRARLIGSETLTEERHALATARALERAGHCRLAAKDYPAAVAAFEKSRDFLAKQADPETRRKAVRLNWNLAQICLAREQWAQALTYLDPYLEQRPADPEPYGKKVLALRKLGREDEVLPALKTYAGRLPDVLAVQMLYGRELSREPRHEREAETLYLDLATRFPDAEVYRALFKLYQATDRAGEILNQVDGVFAALTAKDDAPAETRERARERGRAMLKVLKTEPGVVAALLPVALAELRNEPKRTLDTWRLLGSLAARARQLDKAEALFRQCAAQAPPSQEAFVYSALLEVLWQRKKHAAVVAVCRQALDGPRKAEATNQLLFRRSLALALAELERTDEALEEMDRAIKLATEAGKVFERVRKAQILARSERYAAAIAECEALLKELTQADEVRRARTALATIYTLKGDHEKSEALLRKVLEDEPNDPEANNNLGYQLADRGRSLDEAERLIRRAIEVDRLRRKDDPEDDEENAAYLDSLGWALFRMGKPGEAREWLEKSAALPQGADDPTVWDHLGDVFYKLERPADARKSWAKAAALYETDRRSKKEGRLDEVRRKLKRVAE